MRLRQNRLSWGPLQTLALAIAIGAIVLLGACTSEGDAPATATSPAGTTVPDDASLRVVTTTGFVADWAREVGGDGVDVFSLLPLGGDPHTYQPGARDVAMVADADVVLTVGLGLEADWLEELLHNANTDDSKIIALGDKVDPIELAETGDHDEEEGEDEGDDHGDEEGEGEGDDHGDEEGEDEDADHADEHDHGPIDPHFWFDPIRVKIVVNEIAAQLSEANPEDAGVYFENAAAYGRQLDELHNWTQQQVEMIQPERRLLVTSHDSLSYFAVKYGFEVVGLVIPAVGTDPSAEHMVELTEVVREHDVPAIFGETTVSERLAQTINRETGAVLVLLYSGSLGPEGSGADTYLRMVRTNVERIVEALR